jgi:DNA gyrase subunit A
LNIEQDDKVMAYINVTTLDDPEYINNNFIILCTKNGIIKKTSLEAYSRPRQNGVNAITIREGDQLLEAKMTNGNHEMMLAVRSGKAIRFNESTVRAIGRTASGVRGISLSESDEVVGMICVENESEDIMVVSENGYGKRSKIEDYRITNRGGKGVKTINITEKTGHLVAIKSVTDSDDLMIITEEGITIRMAINSVRLMGRTAQGVKLINLKENSKIGSVARVSAAEDVDEEIEIPEIPEQEAEESNEE